MHQDTLSGTEQPVAVKLEAQEEEAAEAEAREGDGSGSGYHESEGPAEYGQTCEKGDLREAKEHHGDGIVEAHEAAILAFGTGDAGGEKALAHLEDEAAALAVEDRSEQDHEEEGGYEGLLQEEATQDSGQEGPAVELDDGQRDVAAKLGLR